MSCHGCNIKIIHCQACGREWCDNCFITITCSLCEKESKVNTIYYIQKMCQKCVLKCFNCDIHICDLKHGRNCNNCENIHCINCLNNRICDSCEKIKPQKRKRDIIKCNNCKAKIEDYQQCDYCNIFWCSDCYSKILCSIKNCNNNNMCEECTSLCYNCEKNICNDHMRVCDDCSEYFCINCVYYERNGKNWICLKCAKK